METRDEQPQNESRNGTDSAAVAGVTHHRAGAIRSKTPPLHARVFWQEGSYLCVTIADPNLHQNAYDPLVSTAHAVIGGVPQAEFWHLWNRALTHEQLHKWNDDEHCDDCAAGDGHCPVSNGAFVAAAKYAERNGIEIVSELSARHNGLGFVLWGTFRFDANLPVNANKYVFDNNGTVEPIADWLTYRMRIAALESTVRDRRIQVEQVVGEGRQIVYAYSFPTVQKGEQEKWKNRSPFGESQFETCRWPIKIGRTQTASLQRIQQQLGTGHHEFPTVHVVVRCHDAITLERYIHARLRERKRHIGGAPGSEWFLTTPEEVLHLAENHSSDPRLSEGTHPSKVKHVRREQ